MSTLTAADPLSYARSRLGVIENREAVIPAQCYTKTDGISNPCWTCHTTTNGVNFMGDWDLQEEYAFSEEGLTNHWTNLFADRREAIGAISDQEILGYIREDNYDPLRRALAMRDDYPGWRPDLDYAQGFDRDGFANDGSWWRAFRYKPFLGTFWPTNGSTDDVLIRLPAPFYTDAAGEASRAVYKINLAILEAAIAVPDGIPADDIVRAVEPIDEGVAGFDLDGDGDLGGLVTELRGLPRHYVGGAAEFEVQRHLYPLGTEFLHTVRYVDPQNPALLSTRMKEVRYSRKFLRTDPWSLQRAYAKELDAKDIGLLPVFDGNALVGLSNDFGWVYQGFIEDADGALRLQSDEEHLFCMGCHSTIGVTADQSFGFPRKVPGAEGWRHQDLTGIPDVPQWGHDEPEILSYFRRVRGGDEFRANTEILARFFDGGRVDAAEVLRAAGGGDRDIAWLLAPSRERALLLNKAYRALVQEQSFEHGRDTVPAPTENVHASIVNGSTDLASSGQVYPDGRIWLDWSDLSARRAIERTVQRVYIGYYGRPADPRGLAHWADTLAAQHGDLDAIIDAFAHSAEAQARFGDLTDAARIDTLYQQLFGRDPDEAGRAFYLGQLAAGATDPARITLDVLAGATDEDARIVDHKVMVAAFFTEETALAGVPYGPGEIDAARSLLDAVTADPASVEAAKTRAEELITALASE
jgi:hypothetical protein